MINRSSWATSRRHMFIARSNEKSRTRFNLIACVISCRPRAHIFKTHPSGHLRTAALEKRANGAKSAIFIRNAHRDSSCRGISHSHRERTNARALIMNRTIRILSRFFGRNICFRIISVARYNRDMPEAGADLCGDWWNFGDSNSYCPEIPWIDIIQS